MQACYPGPSIVCHSGWTCLSKANWNFYCDSWLLLVISSETELQDLLCISSFCFLGLGTLASAISKCLFTGKAVPNFRYWPDLTTEPLRLMRHQKVGWDPQGASEWNVGVCWTLGKGTDITWPYCISLPRSSWSQVLVKTQPCHLLAMQIWANSSSFLLLIWKKGNNKDVSAGHEKMQGHLVHRLTIE